jgi:polysaccharide export outer membrane protein
MFIMIGKIVYLLFVLFLFSVFFSGCGGHNTESTFLQNQEKSDSSKESKEFNRKIMEGAFAEEQTNYLIGPGDLLDIKVLEAKELDTEARVNSKNTITFPLLGELEIGGLTSQEGENKLKELLSQKYMQDPHVVVSIKEYRSQRVAVIGSVKKPGSYEILGRGRLLDALSLAEGLTEGAGRVAYVSRRDNKKGEESVSIDLYELLHKGRADLNIPVHMGDIVYVPEAGVFYVDGQVSKPGSFPLKEGMTVSKAVTVAGGVSRTGQSSDVRLVRLIDGKREVTPVSLDLIRKGEQADLALEDQDVVIVGRSLIKSFFDSLRLGLFFPPFAVSPTPPQ